MSSEIDKELKKMFYRDWACCNCFPPLLQGCGDPPPLLQILLEGAVSGAVLPHHSQFFPLDIKSASNGRARSGTGSTLGSSRGATGAQEAFHQRSRQHDLGLHEFGFQRAALPLQSTDLPAQWIAGVRHVSVLPWNQLIQTTPSAIPPRILFSELSNNLASNRLRNSRTFRPNRSGCRGPFQGGPDAGRNRPGNFAP